MKLRTLLLLSLLIVLVIPGWSQEVEHVFTYEASETISVHTLKVNGTDIDGLTDDDNATVSLTTVDAELLSALDAVMNEAIVIEYSFDHATSTYTVKTGPDIVIEILELRLNLAIEELNQEEE